MTTSDFEYGEGGKGKRKIVFRFPFRSRWLITTYSGNKRMKICVCFVCKHF